mgnify:CR=1 FL=1
MFPLTKSVSWIPTVCKDAVSEFCKNEPVFVETTYDALSARTWCNDAVLFELTYDALSANIICKSEPLLKLPVCELTTKLPEV